MVLKKNFEDICKEPFEASWEKRNLLFDGLSLTVNDWSK